MLNNRIGFWFGLRLNENIVGKIVIFVIIVISMFNIVIDIVDCIMFFCFFK